MPALRNHSPGDMNLWGNGVLYLDGMAFINKNTENNECDSSVNVRNVPQVIQRFQSDFFGMVKWPFQGLSDLQLGDKKVTLNHLDLDVVFFFSV